MAILLRCFFAVLLALVALPAAAVDPMPANITSALRNGGANLVFGFMDSANYKPTEFDVELPMIYSAGGRNVRVMISMDIIESGVTGTLRSDRWADLKSFIQKAQNAGLVTILNISNTGLLNTDGSWILDGMDKLREPAVAGRHTRLMEELAEKIYLELNRDWVILTPANEPRFGDDPNVWYNYQDQLMPKLRTRCPDCVYFVMAHHWQSAGATINRFQPQSRSWLDARMVVDIHYYSPQGLTHCNYPGHPNNCPGKSWPGTYSHWMVDGSRFSGTWNKAKISEDLKALFTFARNHNLRVHFSEIGTASALNGYVQAAYLRDVTDLLYANGIGWTCYDWHKNFGFKHSALSVAACFRGGGA
jgi:ribosomal protein S27AE